MPLSLGFIVEEYVYKDEKWCEKEGHLKHGSGSPAPKSPHPTLHEASGCCGCHAVAREGKEEWPPTEGRKGPSATPTNPSHNPAFSGLEMVEDSPAVFTCER